MNPRTHDPCALAGDRPGAAGQLDADPRHVLTPDAPPAARSLRPGALTLTKPGPTVRAGAIF